MPMLLLMQISLSHQRDEQAQFDYNGVQLSKSVLSFYTLIAIIMGASQSLHDKLLQEMIREIMYFLWLFLMQAMI